jgi:hypothetical protein
LWRYLSDWDGGQVFLIENIKAAMPKVLESISLRPVPECDNTFSYIPSVSKNFLPRQEVFIDVECLGF